jgi:hypothetical protein
MLVISRLRARTSNTAPDDEYELGSARVSASMTTMRAASGYGSDRQYGVHDTEDRGVRADAERDGRDDDGRIAGRSPDRPRAVSDVPEDRLEDGPGAPGTHALLALLDACDLDEKLLASFYIPSTGQDRVRPLRSKGNRRQYPGCPPSRALMRTGNGRSVS